MLGQELHEVSKDSKYFPTDEEHGTRFNTDKQSYNKLAYFGKGGNVSLGSKGGSANRPKLESAARFQKSRKKK